jgi:hypothetical protein
VDYHYFAGKNESFDFHQFTSVSPAGVPPRAARGSSFFGTTIKFFPKSPELKEQEV